MYCNDEQRIEPLILYTRSTTTTDQWNQYYHGNHSSKIIDRINFIFDFHEDTTIISKVYRRHKLISIKFQIRDFISSVSNDKMFRVCQCFMKSFCLVFLCVSPRPDDSSRVNPLSIKTTNSNKAQRTYRVNGWPNFDLFNFQLQSKEKSKKKYVKDNAVHY